MLLKGDYNAKVPRCYFPFIQLKSTQTIGIFCDSTGTDDPTSIVNLIQLAIELIYDIINLILNTALTFIHYNMPPLPISRLALNCGSVREREPVFSFEREILTASQHIN